MLYAMLEGRASVAWGEPIAIRLPPCPCWTMIRPAARKQYTAPQAVTLKTGPPEIAHVRFVEEGVGTIGGVGNQDIESAEFLCRLADHSLDAIAIADVELKRSTRRPKSLPVAVLASANASSW